MFVGPDAVQPCKTSAYQFGGLALGLLSPGVGAICYWLGSRKKDKERRYTFYKENVLDPSIAEVEEFFGKYRPKLIEHAKKSAAAGAAKVSTKLYKEFSCDLYSMKDNIVARLEVYDGKAVQSVEQAVEDFDTETVRKLISGTSREEEEVKKVVLSAKRDIIKSVYKCNLKMLE